MNLGKGDAELRTSQRGQVEPVPALDPVHHDDLIKDAVEGAPGGVKDRTGSLIRRNSGEEKRCSPGLF